MKFIAPLLAALALLLAPAAHAGESVSFDMSFTSPSSATTTVMYTTASNTSLFTTCSAYVAQTGATGGTLDIYIQTMLKQVNNPTGYWVDVAHTAQMAAAAAKTAYTFPITRWSSTAPGITAGINTTSGTPTLTAATVTQGILGYKLRVVVVAGAGTSAGAVQTILLTCSDS
jgi:ABC-type amino acid transport substrate-binding protein